MHQLADQWETQMFTAVQQNVGSLSLKATHHLLFEFLICSIKKTTTKKQKTNNKSHIKMSAG